MTGVRLAWAAILWLGATAAAAQPPRSIDAFEMRIGPRGEWTPVRLWEVPAAGEEVWLRATVEVPVTVQPVRWEAAPAWDPASGPVAREHGAMVVDAPGRRAFLVGGSGYDADRTAYDDIWEYDLEAGTWTDLTTTIGTSRPAGAKRRAVPPSAPCCCRPCSYCRSYTPGRQ